MALGMVMLSDGLVQHFGADWNNLVAVRVMTRKSGSHINCHNSVNLNDFGDRMIL